MSDDFIVGIIKKGLVSAGTAAGSKIGGAAASFVLDLVGLNNSDLASIKSELNTISSQVEGIASGVRTLMNEIEWRDATENFDTICANIKTYNHDLQSLLDITDPGNRDAAVNNYILTTVPSIAELDWKLTLIDDRIMGRPSGITNTPTDPLMKTFLKTHWDTVWDRDASKTHANIMSAYNQAAQLQRVAMTLLCTYRKARNAPGDAQLAATHRADLETRLVAQYKVLASVAPDFVMLNDLTAPGLQMDFTSLTIAPEPVFVDAKGNLKPVSTGTGNALHWSLKRAGTGPQTPLYQLRLRLPQFTKETLVAVENPTQIVIAGPVAGDPFQLSTNNNTVTVNLIQMTGESTATYPLIFTVEPTDDPQVLRLVLTDGRELACINHLGFPTHFELANTPATVQSGLVTCDGIDKKPVAGQPTLSAWSRDFQNKPAGEGQFTKGFRVRYRAMHVNRFGESDKSDWLSAPAWSQDSEGYFGESDGNNHFYFPQIALAVDPTGRTESYRIYRQFRGGPEVEVTAGGTWTGNPQTGKPVIFDDFTP
jgi:hypothetical protein